MEASRTVLWATDARSSPRPGRAGVGVRRRVLLAIAAVMLTLLLAAPASAAMFPSTIPLPDGFQPEGIALGRGSTFYTGSLANGAIFKGDLRTGSGTVLMTPPVGRVSVGMKLDKRSDLLFVAGGPTGQAFVYDGATGADVAQLTLTTVASFINDVIVTRDAAYFTDSVSPMLYKLPLLPGGRPEPSGLTSLPLTGDFQTVMGGFNANGIAATPDGKTLIVVNSALGTLYTVDPSTGVATAIDLGGDSVLNGDGILLEGRTLYVVQNMSNQIAVIRLAPDLSSGRVAQVITSSAFDVPTTIARFAGALYAVNARFSTPPTDTTPYDVVRVPLH